MSKRKRAIVFDLDGTLIHSAPDLHVALNRVLQGEGVAPVDLADTMRFIGHGIPNLVRQAQEFRQIDSARLPAMVEAMFAHYLASPSALTRVYPGVIEALNYLRDQGYALGICTNKALAPTLEILRALDLAQYFPAVIGGDSLPQKKPDPSPLLATFEALGSPLAYVGDSEVDAETAAAASIPFALYTEGYRKSPVEALPHALAFADYRRLIDWIETL